MRLHIARLLRVDNSYGNIPLDFSQAIVLLGISGREVLKYMGTAGKYSVLGLRG